MQMAMSKDRVEFTLKGYYFESRGSRRFAHGTQLLIDSLGINNEQANRIGLRAQNSIEGVRIRCRPSQFARFLIMREKAGFQNMFAELKAELIVVRPDPKDPIDVSQNSSVTGLGVL
jgi:hypothetical protein